VAAAAVVVAVQALLSVKVVAAVAAVAAVAVSAVSRKASVLKPLKISPLPSEEIFLNGENIHLSLLPQSPPKPDKPPQSHIDRVHIS
jgi:hypothetical protein